MQQQAVSAWVGICHQCNVMNTHISVLEYALCAFYSMKIFFSILVHLEIPVESDQRFNEQGLPGNTSHSTALSTDASLQEEKVEDAESLSVTVRTQEPSAATGSKVDFVFNIDTFKATDARCFVLVCVSQTKVVCSCNVNHGVGGKCIFLFLMD